MFYIRWMIRSDLRAVLAIENACFAEPWSEEEFKRTLWNRDVIGHVVEASGTVVGYIVWRLRKYRIEVLKLAVVPDCRNHGIGSAMVLKLGANLRGTRNRLVVSVPESNLEGCLFLRATGWVAVGLDRGQDEDTIRFVRRAATTIDV